MSKIGYIRVSTEHQETARQQEIMCDYQVDRIFSEKLSGANTDRPQLRAMLDYVREGDRIITVTGRTLSDISEYERKKQQDKTSAEPVQTADKVRSFAELYDEYQRRHANDHFTREAHKHLAEIARRRQRDEQERIAQTEERERKNRP